MYSKCDKRFHPMRREKIAVIGRGPIPVMEEMSFSYDSSVMIAESANLPELKQTVRTFFPETWLWDIQTSK